MSSPNRKATILAWNGAFEVFQEVVIKFIRISKEARMI